jgi:Flp pilus assembly protein TadB
MALKLLNCFFFSLVSLQSEVGLFLRQKLDQFVKMGSERGKMKEEKRLRNRDWPNSN